jgi:hypothetical protein
MRPEDWLPAKSQWADIADLSCSAAPLLPRKGIDAATHCSGRTRYRRIGRHLIGSQVFDHWRDPDGYLVEHFIDSDMFDCSIEPDCSPLTASGLRQWGSMPGKDFLGIDFKALRHEAGSILDALKSRDTNSTFADCWQ